MTTSEFNKLSNYDKLHIVGMIPQPPVLMDGTIDIPAKFYVYDNKSRRHRIFEKDIRWSEANGIRGDHFVIHLGPIVLCVEEGDEDLCIKAER